MSQKNRTNDPMKTKNGRPRLGPLSMAQLKDLLTKTARPKDKNKIQSRLRELQSRAGNQVELEISKSSNDH